MDYYPVYLYVLAGVIAAITLLIAYHLQRDYSPRYLSYYFYYLLLFNMANVFIRPIRIMLLEVLNLSGVQAQKFLAVMLVFISAPMFLLAGYLLTKFAAALVEKPLSRLFNFFYFFIVGGLLAFKIILTLVFFKTNDSALLEITAYTTDMLYVVYLFAVHGFVISQAAHIKDADKQKAVRAFGIIYFLCLAVFNLSGYVIANPTVNFILSFAYVLPPLIFLNRFFKRTYREHPSFPADETSTAGIFEKYHISPREQEVIRLIASGKTNKEIADELYVSLQTIKQHTSAIYRKLNVRNRVQLGNFIRNASKGLST
jgi:DNA-binding CsgD family transcriptional regulator